MDSPTLQFDDPAQLGLRIAVVTETYPPEINGVALTLAKLVHGLRERGHAVHLVRPRQGAEDDPPAQPGLHLQLMRGMPIPRYPGLRLGLPAKRALVRHWRQRRPDLVHIATEGPLGWSALQAARLLHLPVVSEFRTNFHAYSAHYGLGWLRHPILGYLRKFHNRCALTLAPTQELAQSLTEARFERVAVSARGVDTQGLSPQHRSEALRRHWGAGEHTPVFLCVGRLATEKNLDLLLRCVAAVRAQAPDALLVMVGDGPERERLQTRHPQVVWAGLRRDADLAAHYASADVFAFPSLTETWGNVVPEALASGLPVVAFDAAAASTLLRRRRCGRLVERQDEAGFADAMRELALDAPLRRTLGGEARALAQELQWPRVVAEVEQHYRAVLTTPGASLATLPALA